MKAAILRKLAQHLNISIIRLEKEIGVANGTIHSALKADRKLSDMVYNRLKIRYPDLNDNWLETEKGEVFIQKKEETVSGTMLQAVIDLSNRVTRLEEQIKELQSSPYT